jgi:hypothetical protein
MMRCGRVPSLGLGRYHDCCYVICSSMFTHVYPCYPCLCIFIHVVHVYPCLRNPSMWYAMNILDNVCFVMCYVRLVSYALCLSTLMYPCLRDPSMWNVRGVEICVMYYVHPCIPMFEWSEYVLCEEWTPMLRAMFIRVCWCPTMVPMFTHVSRVHPCLIILIWAYNQERLVYWSFVYLWVLIPGLGGMAVVG